MIFSKNNIDFRQVSSNAQANFLKSKSFILTEITAKGSHAFSDTSKELVLQTYKIWTAWLFELEEYLVSCSEKYVTIEMIEHCEKEIRSKQNELTNHINTSENWYDRKFIDILQQVEKVGEITVFQSIRDSFFNKNITTAYTNVVRYLINHMNHLMFNLHEIDYLLYRNEKEFMPFIYIDNTDVNLYMKTKEFNPSGRLKLYQKLGLMNCSTFTIKLGISSHYLRSDSLVDSAYRDLLLNLRTHNQQICCVV